MSKKMEISPKVSEGMEILAVEANELSLNLRHAMVTYNLPLIDLDNLEQIEERTQWYFNQCKVDDIKPGLAGLAASIGITRKALRDWRQGRKGRAFQNYAERVSSVLEAAMEGYMTGGKINPVTGIFLMKNNFDYADQSTVNMRHSVLLGDSQSKESLRQHYLDSAIDNEEDNIIDIGGDDAET